jgi:hypothetical protein
MASKGCNREDGIKAYRYFGLSRKPPAKTPAPRTLGLFEGAAKSILVLFI